MMEKYVFGFHNLQHLKWFVGCWSIEKGWNKYNWQANEC